MFGTPHSPSATRALLLGSGELGKEVAIELQRLGVEVIAVDRYPNAPAMHVAHRSHVINMLDGVALRQLIEQEQPHYIIPEIEAIATETLQELETEGFNVIPTARATRLTMDREGIRRLLVLSGEEGWCFDHALKLRDALPGDWLWISPQPDAENHCSPSALQTLLGREFRHAVFDARHGFDAAAFAALSGTLKAGSWLVLLLPVWEEWENQPDADSLRWSDCPDPIATPHFVLHLKRVLTANNDAILWRQNQPFSLAHFTPRTDWHPATGAPQPEQQQLLQQLLTMPPGVAAVTAARGRGKSALAGQLISRIAGSAIVTAPAKAATDVLAQFAGEKFRFIAPDALLASDEQADWLVVDEAAAIPAPLLHQLVSRFPRTLLTTTVQGYEGTGRGFLLKFCARFPHLHRFELQQPIRWAQGCPLEKVVSEALVFDDENFTQIGRAHV